MSRLKLLLHRGPSAPFWVSPPSLDSLGKTTHYNMTQENVPGRKLGQLKMAVVIGRERKSTLSQDKRIDLHGKLFNEMKTASETVSLCRMEN